jgi:hypothetical protein
MPKASGGMSHAVPNACAVALAAISRDAKNACPRFCIFFTWVKGLDHHERSNWEKWDEGHGRRSCWRVDCLVDDE